MADHRKVYFSLAFLSVMSFLATACGEGSSSPAQENPEPRNSPPTRPAFSTPVPATPNVAPTTSTPTPTTALPPVAGPIVVGTSVGGLPLEVYRFGDGPSRRMIVAGIHGGYEWNTIALAEELINLIAAEPGLIPPEVTLYVLPSLNPDGEARSHGYDGRANDNGVDLNRNFPHGWQGNWPKTGCWSFRPIHGGAPTATEPETQALIRFLLSQQIEALISYHSAGLGIFAGGRPLDEASVRLAEAVAAVTDYPYPPLDGGCTYTGQLADWAAANGIAAIDVELTNHYDTDFSINLRVLLTFLSWQRGRRYAGQN